MGPAGIRWLATIAAVALAGCVGKVGGGDGGASDDLSQSLGDGAAADDLAGSTVDLAALMLKPGDSTLDLMVAGMSRSVILHVPAGAAPMGLVIALHGNGDTNSNFVAAIGLKALADARGLVVAAPQGITQNINFMGQQLNGLSWDAYRSTAQGNIDLPLLDALRARLLSSGGVAIDAKRVFVFGYSQGGYLAFHHGMAAAAALSCTAVIAAANPLPGSQLVPGAARKIPVALQIGANDGAVAAARSTRDDLMARSFPVSYNEIAGAGHVPFPGSPATPLDYCNSQTL